VLPFGNEIDLLSRKISDGREDGFEVFSHGGHDVVFQCGFREELWTKNIIFVLITSLWLNFILNP
jgi:hypothetical protein